MNPYARTHAFLGLLLLLAGVSGCVTDHRSDVQTVSPAGGTAAATSSRPQVDRDPRSLGHADAAVAIVEYSDYQCPYCRQFHVAVLPRLRSEYIDSGKVQFFVRDLPLAIHQESMPAAVAGRCAAQQGKFWPMSEALFAHQSELGSALYSRLAGTLGLDVEQFTACTGAPAIRRQVQRDVREAAAYGISGTPSFLLGCYDGNRLEVRRVARGFVDFETLGREIEQLLAATSEDRCTPQKK